MKCQECGEEVKPVDKWDINTVYKDGAYWFITHYCEECDMFIAKD